MCVATTLQLPQLDPYRSNRGDQPKMAGQAVHAVHARKVVVWLARAISYLVYFYLIAVEIILVLGFFLLLFGANPSAGFTEWAYRNLDRVMEPFRGIFTPIQLGTTSGNVESIFETSVLFAMIVYGIVAMLISALITWLSQRLRYLEAAEVEAERREQQDRLAAEVQESSAQPTATTPATTNLSSSSAPATTTTPNPPGSALPPPPRT
jgi:hypothetical protein